MSIWIDYIKFISRYNTRCCELNSFVIFYVIYLNTVLQCHIAISNNFIIFISLYLLITLNGFSNMIVPQNLLQTLKCSMCCNYLSIFPVYYYSNEETMVTCGRCPVISDLQPQRQVVYEMTAKHMKFPCQYQSNGCVESLLPQMLEKHEPICNYRTYFCPMLPLGSCAWQGQSEELYEHYSSSHKHYTYNKFQMELDLVNNYSENYVFIYKTMAFVAHISCLMEQDEFRCTVRHIGDYGVTNKYLYQVVFSNDSEEIMKLPCGEISAYDVNEGPITKIGEIQSKLNNPAYIVCKIEILVKTATEFEAVSCTHKYNSRISLLVPQSVVHY